MVKLRRIKHYNSNQDILVVGEGDFSFAASLATAFRDASNMVATSLDSQEMLGIKHPTAAHNLALLQQTGCTVMHGVDACTMSKRRFFKRTKFDRIVFNFPHAGLETFEHDTYQISLHQEVVSGFLKNAYKMVRDEGEVHITHKTAYPYSEWNIEELAEEEGFVLKDKAYFTKWDYPGYHNKKGYGHRSNRTFNVGESSTYKFVKG
ncbi:hypothetical protein ACS0TY_032436 [Phlomoides rotata]